MNRPLESATELIDRVPQVVAHGEDPVVLMTGRLLLHAMTSGASGPICDSASGRVLPTGLLWTDGLQVDTERCSQCLALAPIGER